MKEAQWMQDSDAATGTAAAAGIEADTGTGVCERARGAAAGTEAGTGTGVPESRGIDPTNLTTILSQVEI